MFTAEFPILPVISVVDFSDDTVSDNCFDGELVLQAISVQGVAAGDTRPFALTGVTT
jgi:hypothetical protein